MLTQKPLRQRRILGTSRGHVSCGRSPGLPLVWVQEMFVLRCLATALASSACRHAFGVPSTLSAIVISPSSTNVVLNFSKLGDMRCQIKRGQAMYVKT